MKKNVIVFGVIGGLITSVMIIITTIITMKNGAIDHGAIYGYTSMILAFSLIFVGVKNVRDRYDSGVISFAKAFKIGFYIALIASTIYVISWIVDYYFFLTDFAEKYSAGVLQKLKDSGASAAELAKKTAEMTSFTRMYKNPLFNALLTYMEILPVGLIVSLISALVLKRKVAKG
jgi:uncharacterized protein DUF4199